MAFIDETVRNIESFYQGRPPVYAPAGVPQPSVAAPVVPTQAGNPPSMPSTSLTPAALPPDTLQIGNQLFGRGVRYGDVRALADGIKPEEAAKLTEGNGLDEIYFTDETGKNFVMFVEKGTFDDVRVGYLGRFNGKRIKVMAVDSEANTFKEGFTSIWRWLNDTLHSSFGSEASKSISGLIATSIGTFIAAAAIKTGAPAAAPVALPAARGFVASMGHAAVGACASFVNTMASVALFAVGAVGGVSLIAGIRGHYAKGDYKTLDMVTGNY